MKIIFLNLVLFFFFTTELGARVTLYLYPSFAFKNKSQKIISLYEIARIESPREVFDYVNTIKLANNLYSKGAIERDDLYRYLKSKIKDEIVIIGNAVTVVSPSDISYNQRQRTKYAIKSGDAVQVILTKGNIQVRIKGKAMKKGSIGDTIPVRIRNKKIIQATIKSVNQVNISL